MFLRYFYETDKADILMLKLINYMTNFKRLPILIIILLVAGVFFAGSVKREVDPPGKYEKILHNVTDMLKEAHYSPKLIDEWWIE